MIRVSSRSELWFGEYMDESVIIKKIKSNAASKTVLREFVTEIEHMVELKHSRIATFKGAMWDNEGTELCAVVEYVENGALRDCIASSMGLSVSKQHAIARQITDALVFLHQKRIVHGRLNSFNVLLDRDYSAKLSVFSIFHYVKLSPLDAECGIFAAPEVLRGGQPTEKSDVYSLGVILVELDTGENPVVNAKRTATAASASASRKDNESVVSPTSRQIGFRLSVHCSPVLKEIIAACLEKEPARRPKMSEIAFALQTGRSLQR
jgi:serine/threonine protein kinase